MVGPHNEFDVTFDWSTFSTFTTCIILRYVRIIWLDNTFGAHHICFPLHCSYVDFFKISILDTFAYFVFYLFLPYLVLPFRGMEVRQTISVITNCMVLNFKTYLSLKCVYHVQEILLAMSDYLANISGNSLHTWCFFSKCFQIITYHKNHWPHI